MNGTKESIAKAVKQDLRDKIENALISKDYLFAYQTMQMLFHHDKAASSCKYILSRSYDLVAHLPFIRCRVAFVRSFTVEPILPYLEVLAFLNKIVIDFHVCDFNTYNQDILDPNSSLYKFNPDIVFCVTQMRDLSPALWDGKLNGEDSEIKDRILNQFRTLVESFRNKSQASLVISNLDRPTYYSKGLLDLQIACSQSNIISEINTSLYQYITEQKGVYLLNYEMLVNIHGQKNWFSYTNWLTSRLPIASDHLFYMANEWLKFIIPLNNQSCKCLVLDLDNTLWGGVVGEDGITGIQIGDEYPGCLFRDFQKYILDLYDRGIILAISSKNNENDVANIFNNHPSMLLKREHFSCLKINWNDKSQSLIEISRELNIGLDSLVFFDDNPYERLLVRQRLPEVTVIELTNDPLSYVDALRNCPRFEKLTSSLEDSNRSQYYAQQTKRDTLLHESTSLEDFYYSLAMSVTIEKCNNLNISRVAQLTQKTNQFNLTTIRRTEQDISVLHDTPDWDVKTYSVKDTFGDNGIVAISITHQIQDILEIDSFLMSCRVIGRTLETAVLSVIMSESRQMGIKHIQGWYIPTTKNLPAKDFYLNHGFYVVQEQKDAILWGKELTDEIVQFPDWFQFN